MNNIFDSFNTLTVLLAAAGALIKMLSDHRERRRAEKQVDEAEKRAYQSAPESMAARTEELAKSQSSLEEQARELARIIAESRSAVQMGNLFNLYSKQIEKYQTQTQARAGWSFIFAIVAMAAGLALVVWGGTQVIAGSDWKNVTAGSLVSVIGGAISAFITKTFLDVHRLSLIQLNHYFRQPVLNSHILTAQRLADALIDSAARQKAYEAIIAQVSVLISAEPIQATDIYGRPVLDGSVRAKPSTNE